MSRLLPVPYAAGSGSLSSISRLFVHPSRPAARYGLSHSFSTTLTTANHEQAPRDLNQDWENVESTNHGFEGFEEGRFREGTTQTSHTITSRTPRHSLMEARPSFDAEEALNGSAVDIPILTRAPSVYLQTSGLRDHKGVESGDSGPRLGLPSTSNNEGTFRLPRAMNHLPPLGTLPRTNYFNIQDHTEDSSLHNDIGELDDRKRNTSPPKHAVSRGIGAKARSPTPIEQLPIHPHILRAITENPDLYGATPAESAVFQILSSGKDVFIRQHADSHPAHLLPIAQRVLRDQDQRPGSSFAHNVKFAKHIAKIRPISALIISPWRMGEAGSVYLTKKLLKYSLGQRVSTALLGMSETTAQMRILEGCDVLVANPIMLSRLLNDADQRVEIRRKLARLKVLVVEDVDVFAKKRIMRGVHNIVNDLFAANDEQHSRPQVVLVSATGLKGPVKELADVLLSTQHELVEGTQPNHKIKPRFNKHAHGKKRAQHHGKN